MKTLPKIWEYKFKIGRDQPETKITGNTFEECFKKTKEFFLNKGININSESVGIQIKRQNDGPLLGRVLTIRETISGALALLKHAANKPASPEEIERRATICAVCPKLATSSDCMVCGGSKRVAEIITTIKNKYGHDIKIPAPVKSKYCGVCGCSMALLIVSRFDGQTSEDNIRQNERPMFCWLKEISPKFTKE